MNLAILALTALIPMITGFIWYNKLVFGKAWMRASNIRENELPHRNMAVILLITYVLGFMLSAILMALVIHQFAIGSILANEPAMKDPNSALSLMVKDFMGKYGQNFRTFKHGAFHGTIAGLFFAMPVLTINALFERKRFAYIAIHTGYWMLTLALMGGMICQFCVV